MTDLVCPTCQRPVTEPDAMFCARCGAALPAPTTIELADPTPSAALTPPTTPPAALATPSFTATPSLTATPSTPNRIAALFALAGAAMAIVGAFQVWLRISILSLDAPGSAQTGWTGGDGRTIVVAGAVGALAGAGLLVGRRDLWLKVTLLISGGVTFVIALVNMVGASSKAHDIEVRFGIPSSDVKAEVGIGLFVVAIGGIALLAAGLRATTSPAATAPAAAP